MAVFLTGATGFLGRHLLARLLQRGEEPFVLVHARDAVEAHEKVTRALASIGVPRRDIHRVAVIVGDLSRPDLGLTPSARDRVLAAADWFIHCGAHVRFDAPPSDARVVNVGGTRAMLNLALQRRRGVRRFDHVSTAFVAGRRTDVVLEAELDGRLGHRNAYEATKFEAELAVREAGRDLPIAVFRPSIVVGDSHSGRTTSFNMIYWPARIYASGLWRICPGIPTTPVDLVPVDVVADAMLEIARKPASIGKCFHLAAGPAGAMTLRGMADVLRARFPGRKPVRFVDPGPWMRWVHPVLRQVTLGATRRTVRRGEYFVPYFTANPVFDNTTTIEFLAGSSVVIPHVREYVDRLFDYCIQTEWGRRPLEPAALDARE